MADRETLLSLASRCEQEEPSRELDAAIACVAGWQHDAAMPYPWCDPETGIWRTSVPAFSKSLDAAVTLVPEGHSFSLTDWSTDCEKLQPRARVFHKVSGGYECAWRHARTPALALCAASLRAMAA